RVVPLFLSDGGQRPVPRTDDRLLRQRQDFFPIVSQSVLIRNIPAAHGARKKRVTHHGNGSLQSGYDVGDPAGRMSGRQSRLNLERSDLKTFSLGDWLGPFLGFQLRNVSGCAS